MSNPSNQKFLISGLGGGKKLRGEIKVGGAKNAVLKALAASILFEDEVKLRRVPAIEDVFRSADLLRELGARVEEKNGQLIVSTSKISSGNLATDISKRLRASIVFTGPLLARFGKVSFPHPGGCVIGARPIDLFLDGFRKMGARISAKGSGENTYYIIRAEKGGLYGAEIFFKNQSVTGTETFMLAGVLAKGETVIKNAALEPEIAHLAEFLNKCGAKIKGAGTQTISIKGGGFLRAKGRIYETPPDRIEAGSFVILAVLAGRDVTISECEPKHLEALLEILSSSGVKFSVGKKEIRVRAGRDPIRAINIKTHEYPGLPTDLQAPMVVYLTQAKGESQVFETIFEGRLNYTESLKRMGADIVMMDQHRVRIKGPKILSGKELESPDLRAGLSFIIAAVVAKGESVIHNVYNIDRGYEKIEERLKKIGVSIDRLSGE